MANTPPRWSHEHSSTSQSPTPQARGSLSRSILPPPVTASMIHSSASLPRLVNSPRTSPNMPGRSSDMDSLLRQQRSLESDLHTLLDAQADALLAGLSGPLDRANSTATASAASSPSLSAKDTYPTASALFVLPAAGKAMPVRQPPPAGPLSLRAARRGIWDTMRSLSALKATEAATLTTSLAQTTAKLAQIDAWTSKRAGLRTSIATTLQDDAEGDGARASTLRNEQAALDEQITALEQQLSELRSQKRAVGLELREVENRVQARLSSFRGALSEVERDVERFVRAQRGTSGPRSRQQGKGGAIRLNDSEAQQEALHEVHEEQHAEREELERRIHEADVEREALEEGAFVWNDAIGEITKFERTLAREIRLLEKSSGGSGERSGAAEQAEGETTSTPSSVDLVALMDDTLALVESKVKLAEARGWNLLVAAIGAELDAFQQGREILFGVISGNTRSVSPAVERVNGNGTVDTVPAADVSEGIREDEEEGKRKDDDKDGQDQPGSPGLVSPSRRPRPHQNDPDPDLLLSG